MTPTIRNLRNLTRPFDRPLLDMALKGCDVMQLVLTLECVLHKRRIDGEHEGHARIAVLVLKAPFPRNEMYCNCQPIAYQFTAEELRAMREGINAMCAALADTLEQQPADVQQLTTKNYRTLRALYAKVRTPVAEGGGQ